jgi:hypothetical protein
MCTELYARTTETHDESVEYQPARKFDLHILAPSVGRERFNDRHRSKCTDHTSQVTHGKSVTS